MEQYTLSEVLEKMNIGDSASDENGNWHMTKGRDGYFYNNSTRVAIVKELFRVSWIITKAKKEPVSAEQWACIGLGTSNPSEDLRIKNLLLRGYKAGEQNIFDLIDPLLELVKKYSHGNPADGTTFTELQRIQAYRDK